MRRRHKKQYRKPDRSKAMIPRIWLMTDQRLGTYLVRAVQRLPQGSGVVFRHYDMEPVARRSLFREIRRICTRRGHSLILAGSEKMALVWGADGYHDRMSPRAKSRRLIRSAPAHDVRELTQARGVRVDLVFLSPVFMTKSHPGARILGRTGLFRLARLAPDQKIIALGGMNTRMAVTLDARQIHGWAAISAFSTARVKS